RAPNNPPNLAPRHSLVFDAICIDQKNVSELSEQVANMRAIYAASDMTVVWLGPPDEMTLESFKKVYSLSEYWSNRSESTLMSSIIDEDIETANDSSHSDLMWWTRPWRALLSLFCRSWFERTWVAQELCVARAAVFQCGECVTEWSVMYNVHRMIAYQIESINESSMKSSPIFLTRVKVLLWYIYNKTQPSRNLNLMLHGVNLNELRTGRIPLVNVLMRLRGTHAADPRDKVFAAFGLANTEEQIPVDYSLSNEVVYTKTAQKLILLENSLLLLAYCHYSSRLIDVPSWVPDWSDTTRSDSFSLPQGGLHSFGPDHGHTDARLYQTAGGSEPWVDFRDDGHRMIVKAAVIGRVFFLSSHRLCGSDSIRLIQPSRQAGQDNVNRLDEDCAGLPDTYTPETADSMQKRTESGQLESGCLESQITDYQSHPSTRQETTPSSVKEPAFAEIRRYDRCIQQNQAQAALIVESICLREWLEHPSHSDPTSFSLVDRSGWLRYPNVDQGTFTELIYKPKTQTLLAAYRRTVLADVMVDTEDYVLRTSGVIGSLAQTTSDDIVMRTLMARLDGRLFAVSDQGYFSLVPAKSCIQDVIAIVQGSELPLILRPSENGFLFIGQAYVHGVMDGEVWRDVEEGIIPLEEISII
ncbi:MAG: hypothetical protein LQ345_006276, partial [Seirophora villosa]